MRFNEKTKGTNTIVNYEGGLAYKTTPELELYSLVCNSLLQDKYYENTSETLQRLRKLILDVSPSFVLKLSLYAREQMNLRSIPIVLLVELCKGYKGNLLEQTITRVIKRADELTEFLAYYQIANNRTGTKKLNKLAKVLQHGIANAFDKFDEYQIAKYNQKTDIRIRDALFLTHPKPKNEEQEKLFKKIANDTLETPYTWEVELSEAGKNDKSKTQVWEELLDSNKLGYMALLRNLKNILNANVSTGHIQKIANKLSNESEVLKSKQLPFRFLSAYRELEMNDNPYTNILMTALDDAVTISVKNLEGFDGNTLVACDVSGSMEHNVSPSSKIQYYDIGLLLGHLLQIKSNKTITGIFGEKWQIKHFSKKTVLPVEQKLGNVVGHSTNGYLVLEYMIKNKILVDKICIFTDCQMYDSVDGVYTPFNKTEPKSFAKNWVMYKQMNPTAKLYIFDLAGLGQVPVNINEHDVYTISGWSDKIFAMLNSLEKGSTIIKEINEYM